MSTLPRLRKFPHPHTTGLGAILAAAACLAAWSEPTFAESAEGGACVPSAYRVILDVGHTAAVPGALSARGATEYSFNMQLADAIKQALVDAGFDQTIKLITGAPPWRGLFQRAVRANDTHADLFIAIHHDSVPDSLTETWEYDNAKEPRCFFRSCYLLRPLRSRRLARAHKMGPQERPPDTTAPAPLPIPHIPAAPRRTRV